MNHYLKAALLFLISATAMPATAKFRMCGRPCDFSVRSYSVSADYLFWQAQGDQLQYALTVPGGVPDEGLAFADTIIVENQNFKPASGLRIKAGCSLCHDWNFFINWTHLNKSSCIRATEKNQGIITTQLFGLLDAGGLTATEAQSSWGFDFNTIDLEIARDWNPIEELAIKYHLGLKWAKIDQLQNIAYHGMNDNTTALLQKGNDFSAVGPRIGIDAKYYLWRGIHLIGNASGSLLYGAFKTQENYVLSNTIITLAPKIVECKKRLRPMVQLLVGLDWEKEYCAMLFEIGAAYEAQYWWGQWQGVASGISTLSGIGINGDFMTHGLTLHFGIRF